MYQISGKVDGKIITNIGGKIITKIGGKIYRNICEKTIKENRWET